MVWTITLERISTKEVSPFMVVRRETDREARDYAALAIADQPDLRIVKIEPRKD